MKRSNNKDCHIGDLRSKESTKDTKRAKNTTDYEMESNSNELLRPFGNEKFINGLSILANTASKCDTNADGR